MCWTLGFKWLVASCGPHFTIVMHHRSEVAILGRRICDVNASLSHTYEEIPFETLPMLSLWFRDFYHLSDISAFGMSMSMNDSARSHHVREGQDQWSFVDTENFVASLHWARSFEIIASRYLAYRWTFVAKEQINYIQLCLRILCPKYRDWVNNFGWHRIIWKVTTIHSDLAFAPCSGSQAITSSLFSLEWHALQLFVSLIYLSKTSLHSERNGLFAWRSNTCLLLFSLQRQ